MPSLCPSRPHYALCTGALRACGSALCGGNGFGAPAAYDVEFDGAGVTQRVAARGVRRGEFDVARRHLIGAALIAVRWSTGAIGQVILP